MISYWVTRDGSFGIRAYRENRGRAIADRFQTHLYDDIGREIRLSSGAQIFSALERLTDCQRRIVAALWDAHATAAPQAPRLNDPRRALLRFPLLKSLHERGLNTYRVFRAADVRDVTGFPVFIRRVHDHSGPRTQLLHSRREVTAALWALRLRGHRLQELMIVEFCNTTDRDGLFRKFAAFKVGDRIIPWHIMVSSHWSVKSKRNEPTEERARENLEYLEQNPHEPWLQRVFAIAGVDYGRVDYGVIDGVPQVWEINLNPTIGRPVGWPQKHALPPEVKNLLDAGRELSHRRLREAFVALDSDGQVPEITVTVDESLLADALKEAAARDRKSRVLTRLSALRYHSRLGPPARAILRIFPRH